MKIFSQTPEFRFLDKRVPALILSVVLILSGLAAFGLKGFQYGVDFRGGTVIQIKFQETPPLQELRDLFKDKLTATVDIASFGGEESNEILLTVSQTGLEESGRGLNEEADITKVFEGTIDGYEIRRIETVGPRVGEELKSKAVQAIFYCLIGILLYLWIRFRLIYGIGAVFALFHDVLITLGLFALMEKEITLPVVAALLTIVGYSLNDTIVVFDRVRENISKMPKLGMFEIVNVSVNESLSRTILTSVTTLIVVLSLFFLGGEIIHDFSFALLIGVMVGTYSSVFIASPVMIFLDEKIKARKQS